MYISLAFVRKTQYHVVNRYNNNAPYLTILSEKIQWQYKKKKKKKKKTAGKITDNNRNDMLKLITNTHINVLKIIFHKVYELLA